MSSPLRNMWTAQGVLRSILLAAADGEEMELCVREGFALLNMVRDLGAEIGAGMEAAATEPSPHGLDDMVLSAWVGADEFDGSRGIKSAMSPVGWIPLAAKSEHEYKMSNPDLVAQLGRQATTHNVTIYLARFKFSQVVFQVAPDD